MTDLAYMPVTEQIAALRDKAMSAADIADVYLDRIARYSGPLRAYISHDADAVRQAARAADDTLAAMGDAAPPLTGVCLGIKDVIDTADLPTTCGSAAFADHRPARDAACVAALKAAGAISLGKLNTFEFALVAPSPVYGNAVNPWDAGLSPGGSSNGSGVAVAAGLAAAALGTDTGGSVRVPASACGVVGYKPSFGAISTAGVNPIAHSIDHVGVLARTVADAWLLAAIMAGRPARSGADPIELNGLRVGMPRPGETLFGAAVADVAGALEEAARILAAAGAVVNPVALPDTSPAPAIWTTLAGAEAAAWHRSHQERWDRYGPVARQFVESGMTVKAVDFIKMQEMRAAFSQSFAATMQDLDVLLVPTTLTGPIRATGELAPNDVPRLGERALTLMETVVGPVMPFDLTGQPAIALPAGLDPHGRPLSVQLVGKRGDDARLLAVAERLEAGLAFRARPPVEATAASRAG